MNSVIKNKFLSFGHRMSGIIFSRTYAKPTATTTAAKAKAKKIGKVGPIAEKITLPVETDVNKLVNYVCGSNIYEVGKDIKLKPESEYPEWLWDIHIGPPKKLEDLDPNSKAYWRKVRNYAMRRNNKLNKLKPFN